MIECFKEYKNCVCVFFCDLEIIDIFFIVGCEEFCCKIFKCRR